MNGIGATDVEIRVLGCLIEKQRATPDHYPLTLNSLRLACNQSTNREPVVDYDEATIREALGRLGRRRWIRSASGHTSRAAKYRHLLEEELKLSGEDMSLLAVMMLRGPQTPGELKQRTERLFKFESLEEVLMMLDDLIERRLVERLQRRPGQKEERYRQLLGGDEEDAAPVISHAASGEQVGGGRVTTAAEDSTGTSNDDFTSAGSSSASPSPAVSTNSVESPLNDDSASPVSRLAEGRLDRLEAELAELKREVAELRSRLADA